MTDSTTSLGRMPRSNAGRPRQIHTTPRGSVAGGAREGLGGSEDAEDGDDLARGEGRYESVRDKFGARRALGRSGLAESDLAHGSVHLREGADLGSVVHGVDRDETREGTDDDDAPRFISSQVERAKRDDGNRVGRRRHARAEHLGPFAPLLPTCRSM